MASAPAETRTYHALIAVCMTETAVHGIGFGRDTLRILMHCYKYHPAWNQLRLRVSACVVLCRSLL